MLEKRPGMVTSVVKTIELLESSPRSSKAVGES